jgi:hypothetical protein
MYDGWSFLGTTENRGAIPALATSPRVPMGGALFGPTLLDSGQGSAEIPRKFHDRLPLMV